MSSFDRLDRIRVLKVASSIFLSYREKYKIYSKRIQIHNHELANQTEHVTNERSDPIF